MSPNVLRIASLDCEIPVPSVLAERGTFGDIFETLLRKAAKTELGDETSDFELKFRTYNAKAGELPNEEELGEIDGVILTGSASSAYDSDPWIKDLITYCQKIYRDYPRIKIFGSCFGHQLLAHAIFTPLTDPPHNVVCKDPAGWEIGIHNTTLTPEFLAFSGPVSSNPSSDTEARLQFVHADHVVLSDALLKQEGFVSVGRSDHCALQGIWKQGQVLTYQGHAEFDEFINAETVKVFGKYWEEEFLAQALSSVASGEDDAIWAAGVMLRFFLGKDCVEELDSGSSSGHEF